MSDSEPEDTQLKEDKKVNILIVPHDGTKPTGMYIVRLSNKLQRATRAYEASADIVQNTYRYLYNGKRTSADTTPKMLEMKAGGTYQIDAFAEELGGA